MRKPARWGNHDPKPMNTDPVEMPIGFKRPKSLQEMMATMIRNAIEQEKEQEHDSWEEANDFEEEDPDTLNLSPYEFDDLQPEDLPSADLEPEPLVEDQGGGEPTGDPPDPDAEEPATP